EEGKTNNTLLKGDDDTYYVDIDTKTLADGVNKIVLRGTDGAGNTRYWNNNANNVLHSFRVDNTKPEIEILSPAGGTYHSGIFTVQVRATDAISGVGQFVVNLRNSAGHLASCVNQNLGGVSEGTVTCNVDTTLYPVGEYS